MALPYKNIELILGINTDLEISWLQISDTFVIGVKVITVELEDQKNILFTAPGNLFLRLTTEQTVSAGTGMGTIAAQAVTSYKKWVSLSPVLLSTSTVDSTQSISGMELYINNIFVNPEIKA